MCTSHTRTSGASLGSVLWITVQVIPLQTPWSTEEGNASRVVPPDVLPQVVRPGESLGAATTPEGALARMTTEVNYQVVLA